MSATYCPEMTSSGLPPTITANAVDEYQNLRKMEVAEERPLTIYLDRHEIVTLMTIGTNPELLTLGYLKNQGLATNLENIKSIQVDWDVNAAAVTTFDENEDWKNNLGARIVTTGCGQGTVFGNVMEQLENLQLATTTIKQSRLYALLKKLSSHNDVYKSAGAVHGCAVCDENDILYFVEDVGRHNAVDAIAGKMWIDNMDGTGKLFYTTGRLTSEMVIKVAQMGISILLSRSGLTQMGLKLARDMNVTMLARAKNKHFLIYNGHETIEFDVKLPKKLDVANLASKSLVPGDL
jgi:FdhD protein